jgi:hypothetical protein
MVTEQLSVLSVLLSRPTDGATVQRPKKCLRKRNMYFSSAFENVKLAFSLRTPKKNLRIYELKLFEG